MSWETLSEGGNPFKTPTAARVLKLSNGKPFPQESDPKYEDFLTSVDFSKWERILQKKSCDHFFGPPKMITCTPSMSKEGGVKEDVLFDEGWVIEDAPFDEDPFGDLHRQHHYHKGQHREDHCHQREVLHRETQFAAHDITRDKPTRTARNQKVLREHYRIQSNDDRVFSNVSHRANSRRRAPQSEFPKPSSRENNRYGKAQSERQWHEEDESDQDKWSAKRLMCGMKGNERQWHEDDETDQNKGFAKRLVCGMKGNEVMPVDMESSTKPYPRNREDLRRQTCLQSFTLQGRRETSQYLKTSESERIFGKNIPPSGLSRSATRLPPDVTRSMESLLKEKPAKPRNASRREWFERSDSTKASTVSDESQAMQMVFFKTIGEECKRKEVG
jgi:hypothetical protein